MTTCRALVPVDTMDIQSLNILQQLERVKEKSAYQQAIASIRAITSCISIDGALCILEVYGYSKDTVHVKGQKTPNRWQACELGLEKCFPDLQGRMAHETPIFWFWGGPPNKLKWYQGTLQTLLDDRVMYEIGQRGATAVAQLIGLDLEGEACVLAQNTDK